MIYSTKIDIGGKNITVVVKKINHGFEGEDISRVYVIAKNEDGKIGLIYNSKRDIWGFPGGHTEHNETILDTAIREYREEMGYDLSLCSVQYVLENEIDSDRIEKQIICFGTIGDPNNSYIEVDESVTEIGFFSLDEVKEKIGNSGLRENILKDFAIASL